jgi:hypothetical protein
LADWRKSRHVKSWMGYDNHNKSLNESGCVMWGKHPDLLGQLSRPTRAIPRQLCSAYGVFLNCASGCNLNGLTYRGSSLRKVSRAMGLTSVSFTDR